MSKRCWVVIKQTARGPIRTSKETRTCSPAVTYEASKDGSVKGGERRNKWAIVRSSPRGDDAKSYGAKVRAGDLAAKLGEKKKEKKKKKKRKKAERKIEERESRKQTRGH